MMVGRLEGRFLGTLVRTLRGARRVLELGTFTGYSSISHGARPADGRACRSPATSTRRRPRSRAGTPRRPGVADRIDYRLGPGLETIAQLDGPFDLVFIDADKPNYLNYYEATLPMLADGGLMVVDNTLWSGRVVEDDDDENTRAIKDFNDHVTRRPARRERAADSPGRDESRLAGVK